MCASGRRKHDPAFFNALVTRKCFLTGSKKAQPFGAVALVYSLANLQKDFMYFGTHLNLVLFKPSPELLSLLFRSVLFFMLYRQVHQ